MVHSLICNLYSRSPRLSARNLWLSLSSWWSRDGCLVLVDRLLYGHVHWQFCRRTSFSLSNSWRHVFCHKHVVPPDQVPIFAWIQGWCNLLGQTAGVSSVAYTVSQMLLACVSMNSELIDGSYSYSPYVLSVTSLDSDILTFSQHCSRNCFAIDCHAVRSRCHMLAHHKNIA